MPTTDLLVARGKKLAAGAGALAAAAALGATLLAAAPAHAAPEPARPFGVVTAKTGLSQRQYPSTDSSVRGHLHHRAQVGLVCKVRTQSVGGNTVWYLTREERATWVSARYVTSNGPVRFCKDVQRGRLLLPPGAAKHAVG
ncbi:SH3 domain-containing protein [Streptomyces lydicus]|uniref:SH3 domain-containing protein n=1 Tax=Streptomyces lydicus TaxID=47763 RepID=UPI001011CFBA|nr:SH3 domain-containing protein [Streptomyces lydicus]